MTCSSARLAGTLYLPLGHGSHPAVVWLQGSGESSRLGYGSFVAPYIRDGIAFFSYDKRGVAESAGKCCGCARSRQRATRTGRSSSTRAQATGLFDTPPTDPCAAPAAEAWIRWHVQRVS